MGGWGCAIEVAAPFRSSLLFLSCSLPAAGPTNSWGVGVGITWGLGMGVGVGRVIRRMVRASRGIGRDSRGSFGGLISGRGRVITVGVGGDSRGMGFGGLVSGRGRFIMVGVGGDRGWYIISCRDRGRDRLVGLRGGIIYLITPLICARNRGLSRFRFFEGLGFLTLGIVGYHPCWL